MKAILYVLLGLSIVLAIAAKHKHHDHYVSAWHEEIK
jgi:hypothetical protein